MFKIKIADIIIEYIAHHNEFFEHRFKDYICGDLQSEGRFSFEIVDEIQLPPHKVIKVTHGISVGQTDKGNILVFTKNAEGKYNFYVEQSADYRLGICKALHCEPNEQNRLTDCDREYLQSGYMFNNLLLQNAGTTIHGSAISYKGQGVIFSAPSGTGKSTHTHLWKKAFGPLVEFINDDKPCVREKNGKFSVYGSPWSGKTELNSNIVCPLKAIVFIKRSNQNSIERIDTSQSFSYLNDQTFPSFYDVELFNKNIAVMEKIIRTTPIYMLSCNTEEDAAIFARDNIFEER